MTAEADPEMQKPGMDPQIRFWFTVLGTAFYSEHCKEEFQNFQSSVCSWQNKFGQQISVFRVRHDTLKKEIKSAERLVFILDEILNYANKSGVLTTQMSTALVVV